MQAGPVRRSSYDSRPCRPGKKSCEALAQYIVRTNLKVFRATDFIVELLQHLPDSRIRLIRRYGLYSSRSHGTWLRQPHLLRLAPEGWKQNHAAQTTVLTGLLDPQCAETSISATESRTAWARLIAKVYEADPLVCHRCGSPMRILAVITEPQQVRKVLLHLIKTGKAPLGLDCSSLNYTLPRCQPGIGVPLLWSRDRITWLRQLADMLLALLPLCVPGLQRFPPSC
jgi:hypothetical protein